MECPLYETYLVSRHVLTGDVNEHKQLLVTYNSGKPNKIRKQVKKNEAKMRETRYQTSKAVTLKNTVN